MSIESVLGRIAELTLTAPPVTPAQAPQQPAAPATTTFADTLAQAQAVPTQAPVQAPALPAPAAPVPAATPATGQFADQIDSAAAQNGVDPNLVRAVIQQESGFDPSAVSGSGAQGLMQLMPSTAAGLGVTNPFDPAQAIQGGTKYLKEQLDRFGGDVPLALAAYNAGPNAVARYGGVPPYGETQNYVQSVLRNYQTFSSQPTTTERSPL